MQVVITVDTEEEWDWSAGFPVRTYGTRNLLELPKFHSRCIGSGYKPTYFVNHAAACSPEFRQVLPHLQDGGEIGMHVHPWTTPPQPSAPSSRYSFLENLPEQLAIAKLSATCDALRELDITPTSYRGGRYSSGPVTRHFLACNGFIADASICPYTAWEDDGSPDYTRCSERPNRTRIRVDESERDLWLIPLTRVFSRRPFGFWSRLFRIVETTSLSRLRLIGMLERLAVVRRIWLNFETEALEPMLWLVRHAHRLRLPYLCFTVHSSSLAVGGNPYSRSTSQVDAIFRAIDAVLSELSRHGEYSSVTVSELARHLGDPHSE